MNEREIFDAALAIAEPEQRSAFLDEACRGDQPLREHLRGLLEAHQKLGGFLQRPMAAADVTAQSARPLLAGTVVAGRYKLLEQIGEGGMGAVWVAEQIEPIKRRVALKLIKPGMDSRQVLSRFEAERQALALMDHPNIARVFDGGITEEGRPFFVMEYVKGVPITDYCDQARLAIPERLKLFIRICQAVQHAHQKGIIHRDLKPSNILVCLYDGQPVPKVIDFGLAKAMHQPLTERTLYTAHGLMVGTPLYMSPEQAEFNNLDVDTRTDVYSLGVLLYELLTGSTPLEQRQFKDAAFAEILRLIKEEEPTKPSLKLSGSASLPSIAAQRSVEPAQLSRTVKGDLDWIVMKSLEKERSRRYETANGLARDIGRYLGDEPVEACPPSVRYRLSKLLRRHRGPVLAAGLLMLALTIGVIGTSLGLIRAESERRRAVMAEAYALRETRSALKAAAAEAEQRQRADAEAATAKAVNDFLLNDLLGQASPANQPDREMTVRAALDKAAKVIDGRFAAQPLVEASIRQTIGDAYSGLGLYHISQAHVERALALRRRALGEDAYLTRQTKLVLAFLVREQGNLAEAEALFRDVLESGGRNEQDPHTRSAMSGLAWTLHLQGKSVEAEKLARQALDIQLRVSGERSPRTAASINELSKITARLGKLDEAEALGRKALDLRRQTLGNDHLSTNLAKLDLAGLLVGRGNLDEAEPLTREALESSRRVLGDHRQTIRAMLDLAGLLFQRGKLEEAELLAREALETSNRVLRPDHQRTIWARTTLASLLRSRRDDAGARQLYLDALESTSRLRGPDHPETIQAMRELASNCFELGLLDEAERLATQALEAGRRVHGGDHLSTLSMTAAQALIHSDRGRFDEAAALASEQLPISRRVAGPEAISTLQLTVALGKARLGQRRFAEAEALFRENLAAPEKAERDFAPKYHIQCLLGGSLAGQGQFAEAERLLLAGMQGLKAHAVPGSLMDRTYQANAAKLLVQLYEDWGQPEEAAKWQKELDTLTAPAPAAQE